MKRIEFNKNWRFNLQTESSEWVNLDLPHDWSISLERRPDAPGQAAVGFFPGGRGIYEKNLPPDILPGDGKIFLECEGAYQTVDVKLNKDFVGRHAYGYTPARFDLTPFFNNNKENLLRLTVDNSAQPNSRWYSGSGLFRPVNLWVAKYNIYIPFDGIFVLTPEITKDHAYCNIEVTINNSSDIKEKINIKTLILKEEKIINENLEETFIEANNKKRFVFKTTIKNPELWDIDNPALYKVIIQIIKEKEILDEAETNFGIRSIKFTPEEGFILNGRVIKLKGGCIHHDNGVLGAASFADSEERKVKLLKDNGYNAVRCAHNPPSVSFLDACDRLGLLVMDEAFDCWVEGKNPHDYHTVFPLLWEEDLSAMVLRDRNHPSIILWSIGNEIMERDGRSNGAQIAKRLSDKVHQLDSSRPVTAAICSSWDGTEWTLTDSVFVSLDVGGYNYLWRQYEEDHKRDPKRIMVGTESTPQEAFESWNSVLKNPYVIGDFVWTALDYLGEAGIGRVLINEKGKKENHPFCGPYPWHQANCGDLDLCGFPRPQYFYRKTLWESQPQIYIFVHPEQPEGFEISHTYWGWPDVQNSWTLPEREGKIVKIEIYSNCEEIELFLNNRSCGKTKTDRNKALFEIEYKKGELRADGFINNKKVTSSFLKTADSPSKIVLIPEKFSKNELIFVKAEIHDKEDIIYPCGDRTIFFTCRGSGKIIVTGNSNPLSTERYTDNAKKTFRGRCLCVIKRTEPKGKIILSAQADEIQPAELIIMEENI